jgi:hypothetical protein
MVEMWLMPQLEEDCGNSFFFEQNGAPHFHHNVTLFLKNHFLGRWIGRRSPTV